jgi:hypothetical protein
MSLQQIAHINEILQLNMVIQQLWTDFWKMNVLGQHWHQRRIYYILNDMLQQNPLRVEQ